MLRDAWLPIGFRLPGGLRVLSIQDSGIAWQLLDVEDGHRALIVEASLVSRWIKSGLVAEHCITGLDFGDRSLSALLSGPAYLTNSVSKCRSPKNKSEALAFAIALRETRKHELNGSLHDGIYVENMSRILPTYTVSRQVSDHVLLGSWLTGGVQISVFPFRNIASFLTWLAPGDLKQIIEAAGLVDSEGTHSTPDIGTHSNTEPDDRKQLAQARFQLPGRKLLETFFSEHVIDIVQNSERYSSLGIQFPSALVLEGPPGCGKTFAVERLVEFLGWPMYSIDSASVGSPYIHETSRKVASVFEEAIEQAPSVIVIDEMEAFLADRNIGVGASHHRVEEVAEFLRRIPEAAKRRVLVIGMTNRIDMIDPAILRRGRFDHVIKVDYAQEAEVLSLLTSLLQGVPRAEDIDFAGLSRKLSGRPLSDVTYMVREGSRLAVRAGKSVVDHESLAAALASAPIRDPDARPQRIGFI